MDAQLLLLEQFTPVILLVSGFAAYLIYCLLEPRVRGRQTRVTAIRSL
jgi:hypothetical protein